MEDTLSKIRPHASSALAHQKAPAMLLLAIEATFREQNTESSPTAYLAALLTALDATIQKQNIDLAEGALLPALLYLLALVTPSVPTSVLRTHAHTIITLTSPLFPPLATHAPALRSQISLYHSLFRSLDRAQLDAPGVPQSFATLLQLCIDPRPKVRKKAAELVADILSTPPAPLLRHPYADRVGNWIIAVLSDANENPFPRPKPSQTSEDVGADTATRLLAFLRSVLLHLHPSTLAPAVALLLPLPRLGNAYLTQLSYTTMSDIFRIQAEDSTQEAGDHLLGIIKIVLDSVPPISDNVLSPAWVEVLANALLNYQIIDPEGSSRIWYKAWISVWPFLGSTNGLTRKATASSLQMICGCITPFTINSALVDREGRSDLRRVLSQLTKALDSFTFALCLPDLLTTVAALIRALRLKPEATNQTYAELLLIHLLERIGNLRVQKDFEYKEAADSTLSVAMHVIGPEALLQVMPLNLEATDRQAGREPRAFLLPLLAQAHTSSLDHFISYFVPLSESLFDAQQRAEVAGRLSEAKVWSVLVVQIWNGFFGYFFGTRDLERHLSPVFSQLLSQLLYTQPDLRLPVLKGLKTMVDVNLNASQGRVQEDVVVTTEEATTNVQFLRTQAESWLAVLFNIFGTVGHDNRTVIGNVVSAWVNLAGDEGVTKAFAKVLALLKSQLGEPPNTGNRGGNKGDTPSDIATTLDILLLVLPQLNTTDSMELFQVCSMDSVLGSPDGGVQKRSYKILTRLLEQSKLTVDPLVVLKSLDTIADRLVPAAKKDRFSLLCAITRLAPPSSLYIIPSLIPEGVLGTKEPSEKTRYAAFELIVTMGHKMNEGGVVKRNMIDGMDEDGAQDENAIATIEEYMTMVAGGLAGASPHMISASMTAISRLVFEFKAIISHKMLSEIVSTSLVFLTSANREIVKSTLGFVKLAIHILPSDILQPYLKDFVVALLKWCHDHKNHFKLKVRHIFERMFRKFGWETVYAFAEGEEASKVLISIKKRKDRAKRKKSEVMHEGTTATPRHTVGDSFEDVLYGSESEAEDSDDDVSEQRDLDKQTGKRSLLGPRIRGDNDDPLDLLQGTASRITSGKVHKRTSRKDQARFKTDEDTGRMIIDDASSPGGSTGEIEGNAYYENVTSVDGFTRGPNGRIKFNKDTKRRREELEDEDDAMADPTTNRPLQKQRKTNHKLGHEFKAKKAKGDVKKGGTEPYAYLSLSQASKQGKNRFGIVSRT